MAAHIREFTHATPTSRFVVMTKAVVDCLLAANTDNRHVRGAQVDFLVRQLTEASWTVTNQGIGVDVNGVLIDGQHRLLALRKAGYPPVTMLVVTGLPPEARTAVDIGAKRTMRDLFQFAFEHHETTAKMIAVTRFWGAVSNNQRGGAPAAPTPHQLFAWYEELATPLKDVLDVQGSSRVAVPVLAAIVFRLHLFPQDARPLMFLEKVITGADLEAASPVLTLRNWLNSPSNGGGGRSLADERYDKTASALVAYLENRPLARLYARQNITNELRRDLRQ